MAAVHYLGFVRRFLDLDLGQWTTLARIALVVFIIAQNLVVFGVV